MTSYVVPLERRTYSLYPHDFSTFWKFSFSQTINIKQIDEKITTNTMRNDKKTQNPINWLETKRSTPLTQQLQYENLKGNKCSV